MSIRNKRISDTDVVEEPGNAGKFVRMEGANFDIIINILIGIRRSISNLYYVPGDGLEKHQFKKKLCHEQDWLLASKTGSRKKVNSFKFYDYAPMVFQFIRKRFGITEEEY